MRTNPSSCSAHKFVLIVEQIVHGTPIKRVRCEHCGRRYIDAVVLAEIPLPHLPSLGTDFARGLGERPTVSMTGCDERIAQLFAEMMSHVMNLRAAIAMEQSAKEMGR